MFVERYEGKELSDDALFDMLSANPMLIERPIVIHGNKAVIGRPPELVLGLLE